MIVVLFGPPGSGRSTQATMLEGHWGHVHLSTRHLLGREMEGRTPLGMRAMKAIAEGVPVPDEVIYAILAARMTKMDLKTTSIVLNGFPRTLGQLKALQEALLKKGLKIAKAIELEIPEGELHRRVLGRRMCIQCSFTYHIAYKPPLLEGVCDHCGQGLEALPDDTPEAVERKLASYEQVVGPFRAALKKNGIYASVDSAQSVEAVHRAISEILGLKEGDEVKHDPLEMLLSNGILINCVACKKILHATHEEIDEFSKSKIPVPVSTTLPDQRIFGFVGENSGDVTRVGERRRKIK